MLACTFIFNKTPFLFYSLHLAPLSLTSTPIQCSLIPVKNPPKKRRKMAPKKDNKKIAEEMQAKAALKPGGVSYAPSFAITKNDGGGEFQTAGKKNKGRPAPKQETAVVGAAVHRPTPAPAPTRKGPAVVVGASLVEKQKYTAQKPKPKAQPQQAKPAQEQEVAWTTVEKAKYVPKPSNHQPTLLAARQNAKKEIKKHNQGVVGAAPLEKTQDELKREQKEAKKRMKELEKQRLAKQAQQAQPKQQQKQQHEDPNAGFVTVAKGAKPTKGKKGIETFGGQGQFQKLQKNDQHKRLPKHQQQRQVNTITDEERQAMLRKQHSALTQKPADVGVEFRVKVQDKWYPIKSLLETNDFEHAPKMVKVAALNNKFLGGFFISTGGEKFWANEHTVDELWMATTYLTGMTKMLEAKEKVKITPYWATKGQDATATMEINRPTLQSGCYPTFTLSHEQKHSAQMQTVTPSIHQFCESLIAESKRLETVLHKIDLASDDVCRKARRSIFEIFFFLRNFEVFFNINGRRVQGGAMRYYFFFEGFEYERWFSPIYAFFS